jgi:hypothetical protein
MTRRVVLLLFAAVLTAMPAMAHEEFRIIGTIARITATALEVKQTKDGKVIAMKRDDAMLVTRDKKKVSPSELKTGANVVVDALGDDLTDLVVVEVRIVPAAKRP